MKRKLKLFLFSGLLLGLGACTATKVSTSYYTIHGNTAGQLDKELRSKGPSNGHALASAAIKFEPVSIRMGGDDNGCKVTTAQIKVVAHITLPRWMNRSGASKDLRYAFKNLADYAKEHEATHVRIAEKWARNMERALLAIPKQKSCEQVKKRIDSSIRLLLKRHDAEQKKFDRDEQRRLSRRI